ncbi:MAG: hypothetical protein WC365_06905 [Candidatus Babeliales bacterium]|jgi:alpha-amylase/alpha-mannosidase (GH57 family)
MSKLSKANQKHLKETADEFVESMREYAASCVILGDVDRLGRMVKHVEMLTGYEVLDALKKKGLQKDIDALCDKAGRIA